MSLYPTKQESFVALFKPLSPMPSGCECAVAPKMKPKKVNKTPTMKKTLKGATLYTNTKPDSLVIVS